MLNSGEKKIASEMLAMALHGMYLKAVKRLPAGSYNPGAAKDFSELTEEQKRIDRYIAERLLPNLSLSYVYELLERGKTEFPRGLLKDKEE